MICPNMRAAQIYVRDPSPDVIEHVAKTALRDTRVAQVSWRPGAAQAPARYAVASRRGRLEFGREAGPRATCADLFGGRWNWRGDAAALGVALEGHTVLFEEYPNAFERLAGALDLPESGEIWMTATPGCDFAAPGGKAHVGGAS